MRYMSLCYLVSLILTVMISSHQKVDNNSVSQPRITSKWKRRRLPRVTDREHDESAGSRIYKPTQESRADF